MYWASTPLTRIRPTQGTTIATEVPVGAGEGLDRDPGDGEERPRDRGEHDSAAGLETLGAVAQRQADREGRQASLEAEDRGGGEGGVVAVEVGDRDHQQRQAGAAQQQRQPLAARDRVAEEPLRHHRQGHGAAGEDRLHEGDRRHREGRDVDQPGDRGEAPAGREPARARQAADALERAPDVDRRDALAAAVLEERGEVGHQGGQQREGQPDVDRVHRSSLPGGRGLLVDAFAGRGDRDRRGVTRPGDRVVRPVGRPADLELDQAGAPHLRPSLAAALVRGGVERRLRRPLPPAFQAVRAVLRDGPRCREAGRDGRPSS